MASSDVDLVVRAILRRRLWRPSKGARVVVVPREPGPDAGAGLTALGRAVCADSRILDHFRDHVDWVTAGRECPDPDASLALQYRRLVRLSAGQAPPFRGWILERERLLRRFPRLLLVIDDAGRGWSPANLCSNLRGHTNLVLSPDRAAVPSDQDAVVVEADAVAAAGAARADLAARLALFPEADAVRLAELAVFVAGEAVPPGLVRGLWRVTGGLDSEAADRLVRRAGGLVTVDSGGRVTLDPVAHLLLRQDRADEWFAPAAAALLDDLAARMPRASPLIATGPDRAWWELDPVDDYLWEHLVWHLRTAGRALEAELLAGDLRWVTARLLHTGPAGPLRDLMAVAPNAADRVTVALRDAYQRAADRLDPVEPPHPAEAVVEVLHNALRYPNSWREEPYRPNPWAEQVAAVEEGCVRPRLVPRWRPTDDPQYGHIPFAGGYGWGVDISPDGRLLALAGGGKFVRCVDLTTGHEVAEMKCYSKSQDVAFSPDGTWLAVRTHDVAYMPGVEDPPVSTCVQVWNVASATKRFEVNGQYRSHIHAMAISADGARISTKHEDGVRVWNSASGNPVPDAATGDLGPWLPVHHRESTSPDGAWKAEIRGAELRLWDLATERPGPMTRAGGKLYGVKWLPDSSGMLTYGDYGLYVLDIRS